MRHGRWTYGAAAAVMAIVLAGCRHPAATSSGPLKQRGYLWQREWTPAVVQGIREARRRMNGVVVLGAEMQFAGAETRMHEATIQWPELRGGEVALALRIAPYSGPLADDAHAAAIVAEVRQLLDAARANGVALDEVQLDFDCASRKLAGYAAWVRAVRKAVAPLPLVITALPAWLSQPDFPALAREADGYVLQVHSVPTAAEGGRAALCDPALARRWVRQASALGLPFSVSLPAYWCLAGYDPQGKLLSVAMDSVEPAWPPGTSVLEFSADADEIAGLVAEWNRQRPPGMRGLLWYRVPIATDHRNWRWPTLATVMAGRNPVHHVVAVWDGENPVDVSIVNRGEAEERGSCTVVLDGSGAAITASEALPGWSLALTPGRAIFSGSGLSLSPGGKQAIGWIRYEKVVVPQCHAEERFSR